VLDLLQPRGGKQPLVARGRVLEALLDLDPLVGLDDDAERLGLADGADKGLVAAALVVKDVLADGLPLVEAEGVAAEDLVGVGEAVEGEPGKVRGSVGETRRGWGKY
jgi:hypothetical protein